MHLTCPNYLCLLDTTLTCYVHYYIRIMSVGPRVDMWWECTLLHQDYVCIYPPQSSSTYEPCQKVQKFMSLYRSQQLVFWINYVVNILPCHHVKPSSIIYLSASASSTFDFPSCHNVLPFWLPDQRMMTVSFLQLRMFYFPLFSTLLLLCFTSPVINSLLLLTVIPLGFWLAVCFKL